MTPTPADVMIATGAIGALGFIYYAFFYFRSRVASNPIHVQSENDWHGSRARAGKGN